MCEPIPYQIVVTVDVPAGAYAAGALMDAVMADRGQGVDTSSLDQACLVQRGDLFLVSMEEVQFTYYQWAPVRCGDHSAYVPWRHTLLHGTVVPRPEGSYFLRLLVDAECDRPIFGNWEYTTEGRGERIPVGSGGCGEPRATPAPAQEEPEPVAERSFVIIRSTHDLVEALRAAGEVGIKTGIPVRLRGVGFDPRHASWQQGIRDLAPLADGTGINLSNHGSWLPCMFYS